MSIFKTLFELRLKAHNRPFEDYLTEIITFVLNRDLELLNEFLLHFNIINKKFEFFDITTQLTLKKLEHHDTDSRPDIAIFSKNKTIFFENKVESKEGITQLKRYAEHLDKISDGKKTLVYLTKHYDKKNYRKIFENCENKIDFISLKWYQIYRFLKKYKSDPIVFELLLFMKQNNLSMNNQFNPSDIITLTNFSNVRKMMDESMFGDIAEKFKKINNGISQSSTCMTELKNHDRYIYYRMHTDKLWIGLGYWMNSMNEKDYPDVGIVIEIAPSSTIQEDVINTFEEILKKNQNWDGYNLSNPKSWAGITYSKSLQMFLSVDNQVEEIKIFFLKGLDELEQIIKQNNKLPLN